MQGWKLEANLSQEEIRKKLMDSKRCLETDIYLHIISPNWLNHHNQIIDTVQFVSYLHALTFSYGFLKQSFGLLNLSAFHEVFPLLLTSKTQAFIILKATVKEIWYSCHYVLISVVDCIDT